MSFLCPYIETDVSRPADCEDQEPATSELLLGHVLWGKRCFFFCWLEEGRWGSGVLQAIKGTPAPQTGPGPAPCHFFPPHGLTHFQKYPDTGSGCSRSSFMNILPKDISHRNSYYTAEHIRHLHKKSDAAVKTVICAEYDNEPSQLHHSLCK